jgi:hypothetical protein
MNMNMTVSTIDLDHHRGMAAQKATDLRRLLAEVAANESALRLRQAELESHLIAAPAENWHDAAEKARYLLNLFAATLGAQDPRRQTLIAAILADFARLSGETKPISPYDLANCIGSVPGKTQTRTKLDNAGRTAS